MALFAKDNEKTVSAWDAHPEKSYLCLECRSLLRLRKSRLRFPHFYHVSASRSCRLYSKSERHLLIQYEIQKQIPETLLEKPFPSIGRIADVSWESKKIIFEIQCSFITQREAQERTIEYRSLGYEIIWILDDQKFNQKHVSLAESWIQRRYFIDKNFVIYDQREVIVDQKRVRKGEKLPIDLLNLPASRPQFESEYLPSSRGIFKKIFNQYIRDPYIAFLDFLLKS